MLFGAGREMKGPWKWRAEAVSVALVVGLIVHPVGVAAQDRAQLAGKVLDGTDGAPSEGARVRLASLDSSEVWVGT